MNYRRKSRLPKFLVILLVIALAGVAFWLYKGKDSEKPSSDNSQTGVTIEPEPADQGPAWKPAAGSLQSVVEEFTATHRGEYSILIMQPETGVELANYQSDDDNFAASLYKLWVAYEGYRKVDDGTYKADEIYLSDWTREKCLDEMIRSSYSPCAEKMWAELGREYLSEKAADYGADNTNMVSLRTNAYDVAQIIKRVANGEGLMPGSKEKYLDSMKTQDALYRRGLPSGFSESVTVYNKVGWNELVEWHDAALVDFGNDKKLVVVVLSRNAGIANVKALAAAVEANLPD